MTYPLFSIVLPVRNEEKFIPAVLAAIVNQDYPTDRIELIVADGLSDDNTVGIVHNFAKAHPHLKVHIIKNEDRIVPTGLNKAIAESKGEYIVRMDAHASYPVGYLSRLFSGLIDYQAQNIGAVIKTVPAHDTAKCGAIAFAMGHPAGVGNSYFRVGSEEAREVDTVPFGFFRREVFDEIGLFDEELVRNQDDEFNGRMRKHGMKIVLLSDVQVTYYARDSFKKLFNMFFQYGLFKPLVVKKLKALSTYRQLIPPAFVAGLFGGVLLSLFFRWALVPFASILSLYFLSLFIVALKGSRDLGFNAFPHLVWAFITMHISYGLGYLKGLFAILAGRRKVFKISSISR